MAIKRVQFFAYELQRCRASWKPSVHAVTHVNIGFLPERPPRLGSPLKATPPNARHAIAPLKNFRGQITFGHGSEENNITMLNIWINLACNNMYAYLASVFSPPVPMHGGRIFIAFRLYVCLSVDLSLDQK